jgi:hypothetical protein
VIRSYPLSPHLLRGGVVLEFDNSIKALRLLTLSKTLATELEKNQKFKNT